MMENTQSTLFNSAHWPWNVLIFVIVLIISGHTLKRIVSYIPGRTATEKTLIKALEIILVLVIIMILIHSYFSGEVSGEGSPVYAVLYCAIIIFAIFASMAILLFLGRMLDNDKKQRRKSK